MRCFKFSVQGDAMKEVHVASLRMGLLKGAGCVKSSSEQRVEASDANHISLASETQRALCMGSRSPSKV